MREACSFQQGYLELIRRTRTLCNESGETGCYFKQFFKRLQQPLLHSTVALVRCYSIQYVLFIAYQTEKDCQNIECVCRR